MNRLTEPKGSLREKGWNKDEILEVLLKLQEYEDTNLTPQQIFEQQDRIEELEGQLAYECECNQELVETQAENEQLRTRLENAIELPCKIGDSVYVMLPLGRTGTIFTTGQVVERWVDDVIIKKSTVEIHSNRVGESDIYCNYYGTLGEDVFLTKEQAEARLKELRK